MVMRFLSSRGEKEIAEFVSLILKPFTSIEWGKIMYVIMQIRDEDRVGESTMYVHCQNLSVVHMI